jgi:hypothetical protein
VENCQRGRAGADARRVVKDERRGPVSELVRQVVELVREQLNGAGPRAVTPPAARQLAQEATNAVAAAPDPSGELATAAAAIAISPRTRSVLGTTGVRSADAATGVSARSVSARSRPRSRLVPRAERDDDSPRHRWIDGRAPAAELEHRRAVIEAAEVELVERDGRTLTLRRLPATVVPPDPRQAGPVLPRHGTMRRLA